MKIEFPEVKDFNMHPSFMGRNGYYHATGIDVSQMSCGLVTLQPITQKGKIGRCAVELPADKETLRQVAAELLKIAETL